MTLRKIPKMILNPPSQVNWRVEFYFAWASLYLILLPGEWQRGG
jgi:hypothetical protein